MSYQKSFLKWAGGKGKLLKILLPLFPPGDLFIEPFVGSGVVFANTNYKSYILGDTNMYLIGVYNCIKNYMDIVVEKLFYCFQDGNTKENYLEYRKIFNENNGNYYDLSALFMYLNRHSFNGLCRFNKNNKFNVPFGRYKKPYFPEKEIKFFNKKLQSVALFCGDFEGPMAFAQPNSVIYLDPPYYPISETSNFTNYSGKIFTKDNHIRLKKHILIAKEKGAKIIISNSDCEFTRELYSDAEKIIEVDVQRNISAGKRNKVKELIAIY